MPPSVREYRRGLERHVLPTLGGMRLSSIRRTDLQDLVDALVAEGLASSTILNVLDPVRRIFDRAIKRDLVPVDPTDGLELPAATRGRDRIADVAEAGSLLSALPGAQRPLWAAAMYAGLRRGELRALRWMDINFRSGAISVQRRWDDVEGELDGGKTAAAVRRVPLIPSCGDRLLS